MKNYLTWIIILKKKIQLKIENIKLYDCQSSVECRKYSIVDIEQSNYLNKLEKIHEYIPSSNY